MERASGIKVVASFATVGLVAGAIMGYVYSNYQPVLVDNAGKITKQCPGTECVPPVLHVAGRMRNELWDVDMGGKEVQVAGSYLRGRLGHEVQNLTYGALGGAAIGLIGGMAVDRVCAMPIMKRPVAARGL